MSDLKTLTREQLKETREVRETKPIEMPEWGSIVHVRMLSVAEMGVIEKLASPCAGESHLGTNAPGRCVAFLASTASGERLFTDEDAEWISSNFLLASMSRFTQEALAFTGLNSGAVEAIAKNS